MSNQTEYKIAIVGGGMTGATAARKLLDKDINIKGQDILIIEPLDRVGGRTYKLTQDCVIVFLTILSMLVVHGSVQNRRAFGSYVRSRGWKLWHRKVRRVSIVLSYMNAYVQCEVFEI